MNKRIVSADYPGVACDALDKHLGATCALFLQACGGDSRPTLLGVGRENWNWDIGFKEATQIGQSIADEVKAALPSLKLAAPRVRAALVDTHWPITPWTKEQFTAHRAKFTKDTSFEKAVRNWCDRYIKLIGLGQLRPYCPVLMQGIQLGEGVRMLAIEGEPLAPHGIAMEKSYATGTTFGLGYANGEAMYLPNSEQMLKGGYEAESFWEYGQPGPLAQGLETARDGGIAELKKRGIA
jgi:neutral ceramidase